MRPQVFVQRLLRAPPILVDSVVAVALAALTWGTVVIDEGCECPLPWWAVTLIAGQTLPLALRRSAPVLVWLLIGIMTGIYGASELNDPPLYFGGVVAVYTVASTTDRRTSYILGGLTAAGLLVTVVASGDTAFVTTTFNVVVFGTAWTLGDSVRVRRAYTAELEHRAAQLEWERMEEARRAAARERVRIARELHDVVAHHVSVIALQSQAAEVLLPSDPERAAGVVSGIGVTAHQALVELRRLLGALRMEGDSASALSPQPGIGDIETLVDSVRHAGLPVELLVEGELRPLPSGVGLSAYRIVQEALTNVLKHAQARRAEVTLRYDRDALVICVTDDGIGPQRGQPGNGQGHGLIGMRERVSLFGGELRTGPRPEGGFLVHVRLPLVER